MKEIETTPAAKLVGEYTKQIASNSGIDFDQWLERHQLIAQELDRRCEAAGIRLKGSVFVFSRIRRNGDDVYIGQGHADDVGATELHAMLGWLLMKEGK